MKIFSSRTRSADKCARIAPGNKTSQLYSCSAVILSVVKVIFLTVSLATAHASIVTMADWPPGFI